MLLSMTAWLNVFRVFMIKQDCVLFDLSLLYLVFYTFLFIAAEIHASATSGYISTLAGNLE